MESRKRTAAIILGMIAVVFAAVLAGLSFITRPPKLLDVNVPANAARPQGEEASGLGLESIGNEEYGYEFDDEGYGSIFGDDESWYEEESYSRELEPFEIPDTQSSSIGGNTGDTNLGDVTAATESQYLCSYSAERLLTESDVEALNQATYEGLPEGKGIIQMVINEMYAKHGYEFENEEIQAYFNRQSWYQNINVRNRDMDSIFEDMTDMEKVNVEFLSAHNGEEG